MVDLSTVTVAVYPMIIPIIPMIFIDNPMIIVIFHSYVAVYQAGYSDVNGNSPQKLEE